MGFYFLGVEGNGRGLRWMGRRIVLERRVRRCILEDVGSRGTEGNRPVFNVLKKIVSILESFKMYSFYRGIEGNRAVFKKNGLRKAF